MLIEFAFGNFRSFQEPVTLSMVAANISSENPSVDENNLIPVSEKLNLLTSAAIYGANASGKTNLVAALSFMRNMVINSSRESQADESIKVEPFKLSTASEGKPSSFEMVFIVKNIRYRYGFDVTPQRIEREWLYVTPTIREAELFTRQGDEIQYNQRRFREGRGLADKTRSNALFLSVAAQFNGPIALNVQNWFKKNGLVSGLEDTGYRGYTIDKFIQNEKRRDEIKRFVTALDLDIDDIQIEKLDPSQVKFPKDMPEELRKLILKSPGDFVSIGAQHKKYNTQRQIVGVENLDLESEESHGTRKLFSLSGPVLDSLEHGRILWIDEMEARMHPLITCAIIKMFNSLESNPRRAQLIFTTHDSNLLDRSLFRRDQIWFTEKDRYGASHLYSLVEFKPRADASFEKNYLRGKYGAIPYIGDLSGVIERSAQVAESQGDYDA